MRGFVEDLLRRTAFEDSTRIEHVNRICDRGHDADVMGDQKNSRPLLFLEISDQMKDLRLQSHIKGRRGLIGDQHRWTRDKCHRDHRTLSLPTT